MGHTPGFGAPSSIRQPWAEDDDFVLGFARRPGPLSTPMPQGGWASQGRKSQPVDDLEVGMLFRMCLNPKTGLTDQDYEAAAKSLSVEVAAIKAVAEVETQGEAFDAQGRPRILFERHYFHRLTAGKHDRLHADISRKTAGGYGKFSAQYEKLERAYMLDPDAALRSASWGRFQIMGDNFRSAGFGSVGAFVRAMMRAESEHLAAFVSFIASNKACLSSLRAKNWSAFAAAYNGPGYAKNSYDTKMKQAYDRLNPGKTKPTAP